MNTVCAKLPQLCGDLTFCESPRRRLVRSEISWKKTGQIDENIRKLVKSTIRGYWSNQRDSQINENCCRDALRSPVTMIMCSQFHDLTIFLLSGDLLDCESHLTGMLEESDQDRDAFTRGPSCSIFNSLTSSLEPQRRGLVRSKHVSGR